MLDGKYVVYKADDMQTPITDCFVLRSSDVFAAQALYGYAHLIRSLLEVDHVKQGSVLTAEQRERLLALSDGVVDMAEEWQTEHPARIPT